MLAPVTLELAYLHHPNGQPQVLGEGGMGSVALMHTHCGTPLAIKSPLLKAGHLSPAKQALVEQEHAVNVAVMLGGAHPHIAGYLGPVTDHGKLNGSLAFEYVPGGSLTDSMG